MTRPTLALLALLAATPAASGATIVRIIDQFAPTSGTLTAVDINVVGTAHQIFTAPILIPPGPPLAPTYAYTEILTIHVGPNLFYSVTTTGTVASSGNHVDLTAPFAFATTDVIPADLAVYVGTGKLTVVVDALLSLQGPGTLARDGQTILLGSALFNYVSLPPGIVPEPPGLILLGIGLGVIVVIRRAPGWP